LEALDEMVRYQSHTEEGREEGNPILFVEYGNILNEGVFEMAGFLNGLLGNFSEVSVDELTRQYGVYLMPGEKVTTGFKLVRDTFIVTDERIILIDHQGVTGKKTRIASIDLDSIYDVTMETAGTGFDDSELTIHYITSPYYKANNAVTTAYKFEFGKKFNLQPFYVAILTLATQNRKRINA
jgi:hypothetical protein